MKNLKLTLAVLLGAFCLASSFAEEAVQDTEINLLRADKIEPAYMGGKVTGIRWFMMRDTARAKYMARHKKYISGEDCFKIDVSQDGEATFTFPDPLPAPYAENPGKTILLYVGIDPQPPAQHYRATGRVRFEKGDISFSNGLSFKPGPDWQSFDFNGTGFYILITPAAGARISFADLKMIAVYPKVGGEIALPNGGKLTRFLLPENASFVTRWSVAMWRGWLWKLTGVALPVETVSEVKPTPGAFAAVVDRSLERGWHLQVNESGITLRCSENDDVVPALFDYLRVGLGCAFYTPECHKLPPLPVAELPAIDRLTKPRYRAIIQSAYYPLLSGGKINMTRYMRNDVNHYHNHTPDWIHYLNIVMPQELYYRDHPEYFMMGADGKRMVAHLPYFTHQCFSNPNARRVMLNGLVEFVKMQRGLHNICFEPGDNELFCLCPECVAFNGGKKTNIDLLMDFSNAAAAELKKVDPEIRIYRCAYLNRCYPPTKVKPADNINIFICLTEHVLPCTLHMDCARNRAGLKMLADWKRALGGDVSRMGFMTYDDARPLQYVRMAEYLNQFGSGDFYMFQWHYTPPAVNFVLPRWNLGEDPDKLMEEFDLNYYGSAGEAMHKITLFIDEYGRNYQHQSNEGKLTPLFCGHQRHTKTVFDRAALDKIYALFDEAIAAAGDDKVVRARIFEAKKYVLAEDFIKFGPATYGTQAELDMFIKRLVDFINMAREAPEKFTRITADQDARSFLLATTGLDIPDTGKFWAKEPCVDKFLADPQSFFMTADRIPGGWYFKPLAMRGAEAPVIYSYRCPPRYAVTLRRPPNKGAAAESGYTQADAKGDTDRSKVTITMELKYTPTAPSFLAIEGQDDDKRGTSRMSVTVNGKRIFSGLNSFPEYSWGRMGLTIPAGVLREGKNTIVIANTTPNQPSRSAKTDPEEAANDPQWGWIAISEAYWLDPSGDFASFLKGNMKTAWCYHTGGRGGPARIRDGRAEITEGDMGPAYINGSHTNPKVAITPGSRVKITVRASGNGNLRLGVWCYRPYRDNMFTTSGFCGNRTKLRSLVISKAIPLSSTPREFSCVLTTPAGSGLIVPRIYTDKGSSASVTEFRMELLPPTKK